MSKTESRQNSIIAEADRRQRIYAFGVTGLAVFVLTCLIWPLSVTEFRSVATLNVTCGDLTEPDDQLQNLFSKLIQEETSDERLETIITQLESTGILQSSQFEFRDHEGIRNAIKIGLSENETGFQFYLALDGAGGEDERELVNRLAIRVAQGVNRLAELRASHSKNTGSEPDQVSAAMIAQAAQLKSFDEAKWILEQIERDLSTIRSSVKSAFEENRGTVNDLAGGENTGSFQFASSKKVIDAPNEVLLNTVNSIDTGSLRAVLGEIENRIVNSDASLALGENLGNIETARPIVQGLARSRSTPRNGAPGKGVLFIIAMFSGVIGLVVARRYQPFETRGFDTVDTIGKLLGIPVIVQLKSGNPSSNDPTQLSTHSLSNRIVKFAGLALFGIAIVVLGFVLINSEVRAAFIDNPLYGCAKIFRIFAGY